MKACEAIVRCLQEENVDVIFGYPGAAVAPIYEELRKTDISHILVRHEQAAGHCANGYARASGKVGVCMATSGPGATNIITAIATAYMDSIPIVIITGQVNTSVIGKDVFQEADITGSTEPFTKHSYLVKNEKDIPRILKEAFYIAKSGRPGPVLVDIPVDLQNKNIDFDYSFEVNIRGYKPKTSGHKLQLKKIVDKINSSSKPLVVVGGGVACSNARAEIMEFLNKSKLPAVHTLMGKDAVDSTYSEFIGFIGMHGDAFANEIISKSDVIISVGARFSDRSIANIKNYNHKEIIHIDIDAAEIGKTFKTSIPVVGDAKEILSELNKNISAPNIDSWKNEIKAIKDTYLSENGASVATADDYVNPKDIICCLSKECDNSTILVSDVGQNLMWALKNYEIIGERLFFTSGGLGTMGYSLPAAIGAKLAAPDTTVIVSVGDGAFQMSLQELATMINCEVKLIIILFNNHGLGMVRELQNAKYNNSFGVDMALNPNFAKLAEAYGINGVKVTKVEAFQDALKAALASDKSTLIECLISTETNTLI